MNGLPAMAQKLIKMTMDAGAKSGVAPVILEWRGSKIPRGLQINGIEIGWTQHGMVTGVNGEDLGTYEREIEFGGPGRDEHRMIVMPRS